MGCSCKIFLNQSKDNEEADMEKIKYAQKSKPLEIVSQYSKITDNEKVTKSNSSNKMKDNLDKKLLEIGTFISLDEYNSFISQDIHNYIQQNKLDFERYISRNITTLAEDPVKFKNNNIYCGNWNTNGQMEGYGIYYLSSYNIITEGIWNNGNIVFGRIFFKNGDIYEGEIKNSLPDGKGKMMFFSNKESYEGDFKMGEMTGQGTYCFSDNTVYSGSIENGSFNGKGRIKWENGTEYIGEFVDSALCGKGKISNIQNEKYDGLFDNNEFNGKGTYYYSNGDIFEGNFEYGVKRGKGIYRRNDNVIFEGNWNDDLPNGNGEITYLGNKLNGFWRNGVFVGFSDLAIFKNINKNIKPEKTSIFPNSLSHLVINDSSVSQFTPGKDLDFV